MSPHQLKHYKKKQRQKKRKQIFRKWHRRIGFAASLFLLNLAVTGILLNHYESFDLHKTYLKSDWLLNWYDVQAPSEIHCSTSEQKICQIDHFLYLVEGEAKLLSSQTSALISVINLDDDIFLITQNNLSIYDSDFNLVDQLNVSDEYSTLITDASLVEGQLILNTEKQWFKYDQENIELLEFELPQEPISLQAIGTSLELLSDAEQIDWISQDYRQRQITLLKFVQDLHSGQILSSAGKLLTDLTGLIVLLLALSGFVTWQRRIHSNGD